MVLDLTGLKITQTSAKPENKEIGVRAHDAGHVEMLAFLFLTPENKKANRCDLSAARSAAGQEKPNKNSPSNSIHCTPDNGETASIALDLFEWQ